LERQRLENFASFESVENMPLEMVRAVTGNAGLATKLELLVDAAGMVLFVDLAV